jgi:hypothetical protein
MNDSSGGILFFLTYVLILPILGIAIISIIILIVSRGTVSIPKAIVMSVTGLILTGLTIGMFFVVRKNMYETIVNIRYNNNKTVKLEEHELIANFEKDESAANSQLKGEVIVLTGKIYSQAAFMGSGPFDSKVATDVFSIHFGDFRNDKIFITCYFNKRAVPGLSENEIITVAGKYRKYEKNNYSEQINIIIGDCRIVRGQ